MASRGYGAALLDALTDHGFTHATGVPCSFLAEAFRILESGASGLDYLMANREDNALGLASGLVLSGHRPVVLMQNSGLGYCLNVLTSFTMIYGVDLHLVVSWRGHADDAVEHDVIGATLPELLDLYRVRTIVFDDSSDHSALDGITRFASHPMADGPVALLVKGGMSG